MICFPNAKINIGLNVLNKRSDGFHNIETVLVPIRLCDSLEIIVNEDKTNGKCEINLTGLRVSGDPQENLCSKAYHLLHSRFGIPSVKIHLQKKIPIGAGMGGGSSDGAFTLKALNKLFSLGLKDSDLVATCKYLGSDCSFFINNRVSLAVGKGDLLHPISISLNACHLVIIHPFIHANTEKMYDLINTNERKKGDLVNVIKEPLGKWKSLIENGFELPVFSQYPELKTIKDKLYAKGAEYASMTGSGSSIYGIFSKIPDLEREFAQYSVWQEKLKLS